MIKSGKKCDQCGSTEYERDLNESLKFVWKCTGCGKTHAYRKSTAKKIQEFKGVAVTTSQKKILEKFEKDISKELPEDYEIKSYDVTEAHSGDSVYLWVELGKLNDEGTASSFFDRFSREINVNERGELEVVGNNGRGLRDPKLIIEDMTT